MPEGARDAFDRLSLFADGVLLVTALERTRLEAITTASSIRIQKHYYTMGME